MQLGTIMAPFRVIICSCLCSAYLLFKLYICKSASLHTMHHIVTIIYTLVYTQRLYLDLVVR